MTAAMNDHSADACIGCQRTEAQVPLGLWRYRGEQLWVCPDCMPAFIHKRGTIMAGADAETGADDAR